MDIQNFINQVMAGNASDAKDTLTNVLSAKAFEALDAKKQELAKTIYNGVEQNEVEEQEIESESETQE